jgi:ABC-type antimicrobial peptide transport system permease subunit
MPAKFYKIIGIVKDMVMASPYEPTVPTIFRLERNLSWINLRIDPGVAGNKALPVIESVFKKISPSSVFDYKFADQEYALKFEAEEHIGRLSVFFAVLTILISCLGLFGLSSFLAEQRTKEIGVRKVLGASVAGICRLLSMDFIKLIFISLLIATPLTYYLMDKWLQNYIYRAEISWWIFVAAGVLAILITLLTVSYQSIKAAIANPVKSLRSE